MYLGEDHIITMELYLQLFEVYSILNDKNGMEDICEKLIKNAKDNKYSIDFTL